MSKLKQALSGTSLSTQSVSLFLGWLRKLGRRPQNLSARSWCNHVTVS